MNRLGGAFVMLCVAATLGCMGGSRAAVEPDEARDVVLQPADTSRVFERFDFGRMARADLPAGARSDPARFGREAGWKARYRRPGSASTVGPLVIESLVDVFASADGAEDDLATLRRELASPAEPAITPATALAEPKLGDEALAWSALLPAQPRNTVFFTVAWRHRNAVATVSVNGFEGRLAFEAALDLARKQQARLESAS